MSQSHGLPNNYEDAITLIRELRKELENRPKLVVFDREDENTALERTFGIRDFPTLIQPAKKYTLKVSNSHETWTFKGLICSGTPDCEVEVITHEDCTGKATLVPMDLHYRVDF